MPNMTSSKSFRASFLPSSLSVLRSNSDPVSAASPSASDSPKKKLWHKSPTIDFSHLRSLGRSHASDPGHDDNDHETPRSHDEDNDALQYDSSGSDTPRSGEPVPLPSGSRRSKNWPSRISSLLLPSLMSPPLEPTDAPPAIPKQHVVETTTSKSSPASTIDESLSTPSLQAAEFNVRLASDSENSLGIVSQDSPQTKPESPSILLDAHFPDTHIPEFSMITSSPQIMAPIPPSPEMHRVSLDGQVPAVNTDNEQPSPPESSSGDSLKSGKLRKDNPETRRRSASLQHQHVKNDSIHNLKTRQTSPMVEDRGRRSVSAQVPSSERNSLSSTRVTTTPLVPRPRGDVSQSPSRGRLRRSWMPGVGGGGSRSNSVDVSNKGGNVAAWVMSDDTQAEYNASFLQNAEKVPELWNENGTVYVYLYPRGSGCGPSFKVPEFTVSSSFIFNEIIQAERDSPTSGRNRARSFGGRDSLSVEDATRLISPPSSPPLPENSGELKLYLPTAPPSGSGQLAAPGQGAQAELDRLIGIRNLFAFLTGQPLVATKNRPSNFQALLQIASLLEEFGFTSYDGTTFGDAVDLSFGFYMDQLCLADCRHSREKTIEALILGERMRSMDLYNEAFAHAAGKYAAIMDLRLPLFEQVSLHTRQALERAHLDLVNRQHNVNDQLEQFEFPALFAGIASSTSSAELRQVRFKTWRQAFGKMRQFVLNYYKTTLGNWPPKASNKKNPFAESGLNRLVLKMLYSDMCALYDLLVDRNNLTSRKMDETPALSNIPEQMAMSALRSIMSEFDRSKPPVLPPIPYDCPQLPTPTSVHEPYNSLSPKDQAKFDRKIKEHELILILNKAYNWNTNSVKLPFLDQFKEFELREARGKMSHDLVDQRIGYWLFLYVVIQSLPVLVVDAPGMSFTESVEYFLCMPPLGNPPWMSDRQVKKMWYGVAGGGMAELSTDAVLFSVEATYYRSHCWLAAKQWEEHTGNENIPAPPPEPALSPLQPPRGVFPGSDDFMASPPPIGGPNTPSPPLGGPQVALRPRTHSPAGSRANEAWRSSIVQMGLEPVPLEPPPSFFPDRRSSLGPMPPGSHLGSRSSSVGNLAALSASHSGHFKTSTPPPEPTGGATFDDILGGTDTKEKKPHKKKRSFF